MSDVGTPNEDECNISAEFLDNLDDLDEAINNMEKDIGEYRENKEASKKKTSLAPGLEINRSDLKPEIIGESKILNYDMFKQITTNLPVPYCYFKYKLLYDVNQHGTSMLT